MAGRTPARDHGDLVAALQLKTPKPAGGAAQLEDQVIDYTAQIGVSDVRQDVPRRFDRQAKLLALMALVLAAARSGSFPSMPGVFQRLVGPSALSTRTSIEAVVINGHPVDLTARQRP